MKQLLVVACIGSAFMFGGACVSSAQQGKESPDRFGSFEMRWQTSTPASVAARAQAVAEVMKGRRLPRRAMVVADTAHLSAARRMRINVPDAPELDIVYLPEYDELRIVDIELSAASAPSSEISQAEALKLAKKFFDELAARKIVDPQQFAWSNADVASTWIGGGSRQSKTIEKRRVEYRITLRRQLNGIEVANSGIRIGVHVSGRISAVRLGGVSVATQPSGISSRRVTVNEIMGRFEREVVPKGAKSKIAWSRVMYVMPETKRSALVGPLYVISYSLEFPSDDRNTVVSRRKTVGFSLVDVKAAPIDLTPEVRPPTIEKTRK
ncbi:MAG TPA: hypothetical protein VES88_12345 [Gemmatimonadaceae bacterium]|nr:hypothetical protein [Gemmatimonadaceae bacterium]